MHSKIWGLSLPQSPTPVSIPKVQNSGSSRAHPGKMPHFWKANYESLHLTDKGTVRLVLKGKSRRKSKKIFLSVAEEDKTKKNHFLKKWHVLLQVNSSAVSLQHAILSKGMQDGKKLCFCHRCRTVWIS